MDWFSRVITDRTPFFFLAPDANLNGLQSAKRERVLDFDDHEVGHCSVSELDAQISDRR